MEGGSTKQIARWIALAALFLIPLTPLLVANSYFFPFITGKAFYFRILVEIAVALWIVLALLDKEYRPRFSWIGAAVVAFVLWMFIADLFAINVAKAFWSNFERMEGWVFLVHLLGFFFAAGSVLRAGQKWRAWFLTSIAVSAVISIYALFQLGGALAIHQGSTRIDATLGNSAYLAIYLLFSVCIALWLALTEKRIWLKWSLISLALLEAMLIFFTETRGTILAVAISYILATALIIFTAGKRARRMAASAFVLVVILAGSIYYLRVPIILIAQENPILQPIASALGRVSSISLSDGSTRFTLWRMAAEGVSERPLTGWGQEGFNYIFNKYYDPSLYQQEQWFDRAHNAFIDWLTAGGVPAFLLFFSLFGTALTLLWKNSELSRAERIALTAALVGYGVHNLFVFDNLSSYIYFFALLALIDSQVARPIERLETAPVFDDAAGLTYIVPITAVVAFVLIWTVNIPGMQVASKLIIALSPSPSGVSGNLAAFEDLAAHPSFAAQEIREQLISFAASVAQSSVPTDAEKKQALSLAISEMQKQIAAYPRDAREYLQLSYVYRSIGATADALTMTQKAIELSPKKEQMWIQAGAIAWDAGDLKEAQKDFAAAYALGPQFPELAAYAAAGAIGVGDAKGADAILVDAFGTTMVDNDILSAAYYRTSNWPRLIAIARLRIANPDAGPQEWFKLASTYYAAGDTRRAIAAIKDAAARFPDIATSAKAALEQLEGKPAGQ